MPAGVGPKAALYVFVLTVVGVMAGVSSWNLDGPYVRRGCPVDEGIGAVSIVVGLLGVVVALAGAVVVYRKWVVDDPGIRALLRIGAVSAVVAAVVLPWFVWVMGFNSCWA